MIRFATIGTGKIVRKFLDAASKVPNLQLYGVYSRDMARAKEFAKEFGAIRAYDQLEDMAADPELDGVYIASPNYCHWEQAVLLMEGGKHILVEKPAASNEREYQKMAKAASENHVILLEAMRSVLDPGFAKLVELLPRIGTIRQVTFQYCQYSSRYDNFKQGIVENAFRPELSNGSLMDIGVYCVHTMVKLFGMPKEIKGDAIFLENGVDGAGTILASYDGFQAQLIYSKICDSHLPSQIQGENGAIVIEEIPDIRKLTVYDRKGNAEVFEPEKEENDMKHEAEAWAQLIEAGTFPEETNKATEYEMKVLDMVREKMGIRFPADEVDS